MRRFEAEDKAAGGLNHPNVLVVHDIGVEGDTIPPVRTAELGQLLDFGLAKTSSATADQDITRTLATEAGVVVGTVP